MICFKDFQALQRVSFGGVLHLDGVLGRHGMYRTSLKEAPVPVTVVVPTTQRCVAEVEWGSGTT